MKIAPITHNIQSRNYPVQRSNNNIQNSSVSNDVYFGAFGFDDSSFLEEPYNGYSILDLFKRKKYKPTQDDIDKVLETWDPDLGDITEITNPNNNNFGPLEVALRESAEGKLNEKPPEQEPPSIFINMDEE